MIRGLLFLIISALSLFPARASENPKPTTFTHLFSLVTSPKGVYSSDWERVPAWQLDESAGSLLYTYSRPLEQVSSAVLTRGVVVVFAKGYDFEGVSKAEERPLGLPFYIAVANETIANPLAWSYAPAENKVTVGLSMDAALKGTFEQSRKDILLRYFVLTPDFLQQHKLTPMAVRKMPYSQLVGLLNTTP